MNLPPHRVLTLTPDEDDEALKLRTRAMAVLLDAAQRSTGSDPLGGARELLAETLQSVRQRHGTHAALALIVDALVAALDDPQQVELLLQQLQATRQRAGARPVATGAPERPTPPGDGD